MGDNSSVYEHAVVGERTLIDNDVTVKPEVKIWPGKIIESNTEVNTNLVWGTKHSKILFGDKGIMGEVNVNITPEFASKLGTAYSVLLKGSKGLAVSSDNSDVSEMLKRSFISGILSAGSKVYDFGNQILPMTRFAVRFYGLDGAIHVGMSDKKTTNAEVNLLDPNGLNIKRNLERKLETIFSRDDFQRCDIDDVKSIRMVYNFKSYYLRSIINKTSNRPFKYKVLLATPSEMIEELINPVMNKLGCEVTFIRYDWKGHFSDLYYDYENKKSIPEPFREMSHMIMSGDYDLGVYIGNNGEKLILIDEKGKFISGDMFTALVSFILFNTSKYATAVVPISAPAVIEIMAERYGGKVIRTKTSVSEVMSEIVKDRKETPFNEQFILNFDAIGSLVKIMNFMNDREIKLSKLIDNIPKFHMVRREVNCGWDTKGK